MSDEQEVSTNARIGIFADTHGLFYPCKQFFQAKIDYKALRTQIAHDRDVIVSNAYLLIKDSDKSESFEKALKFAGYNVKIKEQVFREFNNKSTDNVGNTVENDEIRGRNIIKWDVGMAVDMIKWAPKLDVICLVSGNGAFEDVIAHIKASFAINVEIAGFTDSTSSKLKNLADNFIDLSPKNLDELPPWLLPIKQPVLV